jgi:hypothetical protein
MLESMLEAKKRCRDPSGKYNQAASDHYRDLLARVAHTRGASLVAAIRARSAQAPNEEMADLAELIARHPDGHPEAGDHFFQTDDPALIRWQALHDSERLGRTVRKGQQAQPVLQLIALCQNPTLRLCRLEHFGDAVLDYRDVDAFA